MNAWAFGSAVMMVLLGFASGCASSNDSDGTGGEVAEVNATSEGGGVGARCYEGEGNTCRSGLTCVVPYGSAGTKPGKCAKPVGEGDECDPDFSYQCASGLACTPNQHDGKTFYECRPDESGS